MENMPQTMVTMLIAGTKWPQLVSAMGVAWVAFRVLFAAGYIYGDKPYGKQRSWGTGFWLVQLGLIGMTAKLGLDLISGA